MKIDRVVDVQRGEDCKDIGLNGRDQQLERADEGDEQETKDRDQDSAAAGLQALDDEIAENVEEDVAREHRDEGPQAEAKRPYHERHELDREQQDLADPVDTRRHEQREEMKPVLPEANAEH